MVKAIVFGAAKHDTKITHMSQKVLHFKKVIFKTNNILQQTCKTPVVLGMIRWSQGGHFMAIQRVKIEEPLHLFRNNTGR